MNKALLILCVAFLGCATQRRDAVVTDRSAQCPQKEFINGWTFEVRGYGNHDYIYIANGDSLFCKRCNYKQSVMGAR